MKILHFFLEQLRKYNEMSKLINYNTRMLPMMSFKDVPRNFVDICFLSPSQSLPRNVTVL